MGRPRDEKVRTGWLWAGPGVEMRSLVEGEGTALVLYRVGPGRTFASHRHRFPEYGTVVSGRAELLLDTGPRPLRDGDSYYVPSGIGHGLAVPAGKEPIVILHVAVGIGAPVRAPMFRQLYRQTRSLLRAALEEAPSAAATDPARA
jgi:quercetin dioxygenase-like cupin family protein